MGREVGPVFDGEKESPIELYTIHRNANRVFPAVSRIEAAYRQIFRSPDAARRASTQLQASPLITEERSERLWDCLLDLHACATHNREATLR